MMRKTKDLNTVTARQGMALGAALAFLLGFMAAIGGDTAKAITNFGMASFFVFAYSNPKMLMMASTQDLDKITIAVEQRVFLWSALAICLLAALWEPLEGLI